MSTGTSKTALRAARAALLMGVSATAFSVAVPSAYAQTVTATPNAGPAFVIQNAAGQLTLNGITAITQLDFNGTNPVSINGNTGLTVGTAAGQTVIKNTSLTTGSAVTTTLNGATNLNNTTTIGAGGSLTTAAGGTTISGATGNVTLGATTTVAAGAIFQTEARLRSMVRLV
jgi:hypothetical protein